MSFANPPGPSIPGQPVRAQGSTICYDPKATQPRSHFVSPTPNDLRLRRNLTTSPRGDIQGKGGMPAAFDHPAQLTPLSVESIKGLIFVTSPARRPALLEYSAL